MLTNRVYNPSLTARLVLDPLARVHTLHDMEKEELEPRISRMGTDKKE